MSNELITTKDLFSRDSVKNKFTELLGKKAQGFITSVLQIVSSNSLLSKADPYSVYYAAAVAATMDLPLNNNLGFAYIVPYNQSVKIDGKWEKKSVAQFQMGYKGYIQLAMRSGQFKTINAIDVREGEIKERDRLTGEIVFDWIENEEERLSKPIVGFVAYFRLLNGFQKSLYMTEEKLKEHGLKFSQTYKQDKGLWKDDFDSMAQKTVLKLLLSKYAPLSVELQTAVTVDQGIINNSETMEVDYVDNSDQPATLEDIEILFEDKKALLNEQDFNDISRIIDNQEEASYRIVQQKLLAI